MAEGQITDLPPIKNEFLGGISLDPDLFFAVAKHGSQSITVEVENINDRTATGPVSIPARDWRGLAAACGYGSAVVDYRQQTMPNSPTANGVSYTKSGASTDRQP